ncbi:MAG: DUF1566 domain-containing protein [Candidatus Moduliflexus flocculans]|nr:DUF1566 domain-containing protein [Candidatus Moduliflexus flocculans]
MTWTQAQARPAALNASLYGGYDDWRLPTIKELYSLIDFTGTDRRARAATLPTLIPFIDRAYFDFAYGDTAAGRADHRCPVRLQHPLREHDHAGRSNPVRRELRRRPDQGLRPGQHHERPGRVRVLRAVRPGR